MQARTMKITPSIKLYHSYVNTAMTVLLTYANLTLPHKLDWISENVDVLFHYLKIQIASLHVSLYNIYARYFTQFSKPRHAMHGQPQ